MHGNYILFWGNIHFVCTLSTNASAVHNIMTGDRSAVDDIVEEEEEEFILQKYIQNFQ